MITCTEVDGRGDGEALVKVLLSTQVSLGRQDYAKLAPGSFLHVQLEHTKITASFMCSCSLGYLGGQDQHLALTGYQVPKNRDTTRCRPLEV